VHDCPCHDPLRLLRGISIVHDARANPVTVAFGREVAFDEPGRALLQGQLGGVLLIELPFELHRLQQLLPRVLLFLAQFLQ